MTINHVCQRNTFGLCSGCGQPMPPDRDATEPAEGAAPAMETARVLLEVVAGLLPGGAPDPQYTRRWAITSREWQEAGERGEQSALLAEYNGRMQGYAALLMLQPDALNWVRTDWVWT
jgi:hypothetical protein